RHADADQIVLERHQAVVARDPVVIRIADRDDPDGGVLRLPDREVHRSLANNLAEALSAVDERGGFRLPDGAARVLRLHEALFQAGHISAESRDAMRVDPAQIGEDQNVGHDLRVGLWNLELRENLLAEPPQGFLADQGVLQDRPPLRHKNEPTSYKLALRAASCRPLLPGNRAPRGMFIR